MQLFWFLVTPIVILIAIFTLVDVFRRVNGGWAMAGWVALVVIVPIVGSLIYWFARPASPDELEQTFLAEQDRRYQAARKPIDGGF